MDGNKSAYETKLVNLWLLNDESLFLAAEEAASSALADAVIGNDSAFLARQEAAATLAEKLHDMVLEQAPPAQGIWGDLISSALRCVDFEELAADWLADRVLWQLVVREGPEDTAPSLRLTTEESEALEWAAEVLEREDGSELKVGEVYTLPDGGLVQVVETRA